MVIPIHTALFRLVTILLLQDPQSQFQSAETFLNVTKIVVE